MTSQDAFGRLKSKIANLRYGLFPPRREFVTGEVFRSVENPPLNEAELVRELATCYLAMKADQPISGPYAPAVDWKKILDDQWQRPRGMIETGHLDQFAGFLRNFFRNEALTGFWGGDRMFDRFVNAQPLSRANRSELMELQFRQWRDWCPAEPVSVLAAPPIGNPWGYQIEGHTIFEPVFEYHYEAEQFRKMLDGISNPVILEIGGGFGGLAYQIIRRIPGVTYIGVDLPENNLLQAYYLRCAFPDARVLLYSPDVAELSLRSIADHDVILLPNYMLPRIADAAVDLAVNIRSLSEMPYETIAEYVGQIERLSRLFFFHENIYKARKDSLHGIPTSGFPPLTKFNEVANSESRWPRYGKESYYPCREMLFLRRPVHMRGNE